MTRHWTGGRWPAAALAAAALLPCGARAAQDPGDEPAVAIHAGRLILGNGEEREHVTVLLRGGKVEAVGETIDLPFPCEEIDARALTVMPGLIHPNSRMGQPGYGRSGVQAHRRVADEFLGEPRDVKDALAAGFTTLVLEPGGTSGITGRALVIRTADVGGGLVVQEDGYVKMHLRNPQADKRVLRQAFQDARKEIEKVRKAREEWEKKKAEEAAKKEAEKKQQEEQEKQEKEKQDKSTDEPPKPEEKEAPKPPEAAATAEFQPPPIRPELVPIVDLIEKKKDVRALVEIDGASTWVHLRDVLKDFEIEYALASNTRSFGRFSTVDLFLAAADLGEQKALVLVAPQITFYPYSSDRVHLPRRLLEAGVKVGFAPFSDRAEDLAAMRYQVADLIKAGLPRAEAVKALTLHVAEAVGLGERLGSVEKGKDGNLLFLTGDPFDVQTRLDQVMIEGVVAWDRAREAPQG